MTERQPPTQSQQAMNTRDDRNQGGEAIQPDQSEALLVALTDDAPPETTRRTWTDADYDRRDAALRAWGIPILLGRPGQRPPRTKRQHQYDLRAVTPRPLGEEKEAREDAPCAHDARE